MRRRLFKKTHKIITQRDVEKALQEDDVKVIQEYMEGGGNMDFIMNLKEGDRLYKILRNTYGWQWKIVPTPIIVAALSGSIEIIEYWIELYNKEKAKVPPELPVTNSNDEKPQFGKIKNLLFGGKKDITEDFVDLFYRIFEVIVREDKKTNKAREQIINLLMQIIPDTEKEKIFVHLLKKASKENQTIIKKKIFVILRDTLFTELKEIDVKLMTASIYDYGVSIEYFIENGANINATDKNGNTAFLIAVLYSNYDNRYYYSGQERSKYFKHLSNLIAYGADINVKNNDGNSPLMIAIEREHTELTGWLLQHGADIDLKTKDKDGNTALMNAIQRGNIRLAEWLLKQGADINEINIKDKNGNTSFMIAVQEGKETNFIEWLLKNGADINAENNKGQNVLSLASSLDMITYLLNQDIQPIDPKLKEKAAKQVKRPYANLIEKSIVKGLKLYAEQEKITQPEPAQSIMPAEQENDKHAGEAEADLEDEEAQAEDQSEEIKWQEESIHSQKSKSSSLLFNPDSIKFKKNPEKNDPMVFNPVTVVSSEDFMKLVRQVQAMQERIESLEQELKQYKLQTTFIPPEYEDDDFTPGRNKKT